MNMKKQTFSLLSGAVLAVALLLVSCHSSYEVTKVEGGRIPMNSVWDAEPDAEAVALLAPYKARMDSVMYHVVGTAEMSMDRFRPESLLSNLIADVLREAAVEVLGKPADMGLINIGGIRNSLTEGDITTENIYEILPFENSLCVLTMKGSAMKHLFENIAVRLGEGVSGIQLEISKDGKLLQASIAGKPVEDDRDYTVATIDYLADGNDGMTAFLQADKRECPDGATLRGLFMKYVEKQTAAGKKVTSRMEGRVVVKEKALKKQKFYETYVFLGSPAAFHAPRIGTARGACHY